jgi:hypothetical protein
MSLQMCFASTHMYRMALPGRFLQGVGVLAMMAVILMMPIHGNSFANKTAEVCPKRAVLVSVTVQPATATYAAELLFVGQIWHAGVVSYGTQPAFVVNSSGNSSDKPPDTRPTPDGDLPMYPRGRSFRRDVLVIRPRFVSQIATELNWRLGTVASAARLSQGKRPILPSS